MNLIQENQEIITGAMESLHPKQGGSMCPVGPGPSDGRYIQEASKVTQPGMKGEHCIRSGATASSDAKPHTG